MSLKVVISVFCVIAFGILTFYIGRTLGEAHGLSEGVSSTEQRHTEDILELNKTVQTIQNYYSEHSAYPTDPELYASVTTFYEMNETKVRLYSGLGSAHFYTVRFLDHGFVAIERE